MFVWMAMIANPLVSLMTSFKIVNAGAGQGKQQRSASLASVGEIHQWPLNSLHKLPVTRTMFPFDDVIMSKRPIKILPNIAAPRMFIFYHICIQVWRCVEIRWQVRNTLGMSRLQKTASPVSDGIARYASCIMMKVNMSHKLFEMLCWALFCCGDCVGGFLLSI